MAERPEPAIDVSVVLPLPRSREEAAAQVETLGAELERLGRSCEFVVVLGRAEGEVFEWPSEEARNLVLLEVGGRVNESTALTVGFGRARGDVILALTRYPQVEPSALGPALDAIEQDRADLVVGWRFPRRSSFANRIQSRIYHRLVWWLTGTRFHDLGCGFRLMRRQVANELDLYGSLHRFVPLLAENLGLRVLEVQVAQFRGDRPRRIYGLPSLSTGLLDGLTVLFLTKFTRRPLRFFGVIGLGLAGVGGSLLVYLAGYRLLRIGPIADRPLLLLALLLTVLGVQSISIGLLGEIIIFTHARKLRSYRVLREFWFPQRSDREPAAAGGDAGNSASVARQSAEEG